MLVQADGSESLRVILIDLDLAVMLNEYGSPIEEESGPRFGTPPFVAIELLDNRDCPHYLRHDFESAFYVALWFTVKSKAGFLEREDFNTSHMKKSLWFLWTDGPLRTCLVKGDFRLAENFAPEFTELSLSPVVSRLEERYAAAAAKDDLFGGFSFVASNSLLDGDGFGMRVGTNML